jgi:hypothetical protein
MTAHITREPSSTQLMAPAHHRWYVSLESFPASTCVRFGHMSRGTGHQIMDELLWPLSSDVRTEAQILMELYQATLDFVHTRR